MTGIDRRWLAGLAIMGWLGGAPTWAAPVDGDGDGYGDADTRTDFDPLSLKPTPAEARVDEPTSGLRFEAWHQQFDRLAARDGPPGAPASQQRLALDFRREWRLSGRTRLGLSNRLEGVRSTATTEARDALREAYVSHEVGPGWYVDAGRINWRLGVASGFNPTDFLGAGAMVDQASFDPSARRENRLGTVMLRQQWVTTAGSLQAALIPRLASRREAAGPRSFGWGRTNGREAALVKWAPTLDEQTSVDAIGWWRQGEAPRYGLNLTRLVGDAWVLHAEFARGRPDLPGAFSRRHRIDAAIGATWASRAGPVVTIEFQRDALTAPDPGAHLGDPALAESRAVGREPESRAVFLRVGWDRPFAISRARLAAFVRSDLDRQRWRWQLDWAWLVDDRQSLSILVGGQDQRSAQVPEGGGYRHYLAVGWRRDL